MTTKIEFGDLPPQVASMYKSPLDVRKITMRVVQSGAKSYVVETYKGNKDTWKLMPDGWHSDHQDEQK